MDVNLYALNVAIERLLTNPADLEAAQAVVAYGLTLPIPSHDWQIHISHTRPPDQPLSGYAAGIGIAQYTPPDDQPKQEVVVNLGSERACVGWYRLHRDTKGNIYLQHFWGANETSRVDDDQEPPVYVLELKKQQQNLFLWRFKIRRSRTWSLFFWNRVFSVILHSYEILYTYCES